MPDYSKTQIYMIHNPNSNDLECYVGHTTDWEQRQKKHTARFNLKDAPNCYIYLYKYMRENGGFNENNFVMESIENYPCASKREAEIREQYYIDTFSSKLNTMKSYASLEDQKITKKIYDEIHKDEKTIYDKQYRETHKEEKSIYNKQYRENNIDKIRDREKLFYKNNKERLLLDNVQRKKIWYEKNKEKLSKQRTVRVECKICGLNLSKSSVYNHMKTQH